MKSVMEIYLGSDGAATQELYASLQKLGPAGLVAVNLFRAQKCSERAKVYRGRGYRDEAYERKQWSMLNLCEVLTQHASELLISWGWKQDPAQEFHNWVLYVDLPSCCGGASRQVSFHTSSRGKGPDYLGEWDGVTGICAQRVVSWVGQVLNGEQAFKG